MRKPFPLRHLHQGLQKGHMHPSELHGLLREQSQLVPNEDILLGEHQPKQKQLWLQCELQSSSRCHVDVQLSPSDTSTEDAKSLEKQTFRLI